MGFSEEFEAVERYTKDSKTVFRYVLGNHDILTHPKSELATITNQARYDAVETDDALLLFLDTTKELQLHGWGLDHEQWHWLEAQIRRAPDKTLMIFAHHPVPGTTGSSPKTDAQFAEYQDIRPILKMRAGAAFYFNGHTHTHSIVQQGDWHFVQTAAAFSHPCFRVIELNNGHVDIRTAILENESILQTGKFLHDHLKGFHRPKDAHYQPSDLHYAVSLGG